MQVVVNNRLLRRRLLLSLVSMVGSLLFLILGFVASLVTTDPVLQYGVSIPALLIGLVLWSRNQAYLQRWGPRSRLDPALIRALKGLDERYALLVAPAPQLPDYMLIGPMGIMIVVPRLVAGQVTAYYDEWRTDRTPPALVRLLLWFSVRPTLGNPSREAAQCVDRTKAYLQRHLPEDLATDVPVEAVVVFVHSQVTLLLQGNRVPALLLKSLRAHVRRVPRGLNPGQVNRLVSALSEP